MSLDKEAPEIFEGSRSEGTSVVVFPPEMLKELGLLCVNNEVLDCASFDNLASSKSDQSKRRKRKKKNMEEVLVPMKKNKTESIETSVKTQSRRKKPSICLSMDYVQQENSLISNINAATMKGHESNKNNSLMMIQSKFIVNVPHAVHNSVVPEVLLNSTPMVNKNENDNEPHCKAVTELNPPSKLINNLPAEPHLVKRQDIDTHFHNADRRTFHELTKPDIDKHFNNTDKGTLQEFTKPEPEKYLISPESENIKTRSNLKHSSKDRNAFHSVLQNILTSRPSSTKKKLESKDSTDLETFSLIKQSVLLSPSFENIENLTNTPGTVPIESVPAEQNLKNHVTNFNTSNNNNAEFFEKVNTNLEDYEKVRSSPVDEIATNSSNFNEFGHGILEHTDSEHISIDTFCESDQTAFRIPHKQNIQKKLSFISNFISSETDDRIREGNSVKNHMRKSNDKLLDVSREKETDPSIILKKTSVENLDNTLGPQKIDSLSNAPNFRNINPKFYEITLPKTPKKGQTKLSMKETNVIEDYYRIREDYYTPQLNILQEIKQGCGGKDADENFMIDIIRTSTLEQNSELIQQPINCEVTGEHRMQQEGDTDKVDVIDRTEHNLNVNYSTKCDRIPIDSQISAANKQVFNGNSFKSHKQEIDTLAEYLKVAIKKKFKLHSQCKEKVMKFSNELKNNDLNERSNDKSIYSGTEISDVMGGSKRVVTYSRKSSKKPDAPQFQEKLEEINKVKQSNLNINCGSSNDTHTVDFRLPQRAAILRISDLIGKGSLHLGEDDESEFTDAMPSDNTKIQLSNLNPSQHSSIADTVNTEINATQEKSSENRMFELFQTNNTSTNFDEATVDEVESTDCFDLSYDSIVNNIESLDEVIENSDLLNLSDFNISAEISNDERDSTRTYLENEEISCEIDINNIDSLKLVSIQNMCQNNNYCTEQHNTGNNQSKQSIFGNAKDCPFEDTGTPSLPSAINLSEERQSGVLTDETKTVSDLENRILKSEMSANTENRKSLISKLQFTQSRDSFVESSVESELRISGISHEFESQVSDYPNSGNPKPEILVNNKKRRGRPSKVKQCQNTSGMSMDKNEALMEIEVSPIRPDHIDVDGGPSHAGKDKVYVRKKNKSKCEKEKDGKKHNRGSSKLELSHAAENDGSVNDSGSISDTFDTSTMPEKRKCKKRPIKGENGLSPCLKNVSTNDAIDQLNASKNKNSASDTPKVRRRGRVSKSKKGVDQNFESSMKVESTGNSVSCGVCDWHGDEIHWHDHVAKHNYLAWRRDEVPLESSNKSNRQHVLGMLARFGGLICRLCRTTLSTYDGYKYHLQKCEEREERGTTRYVRKRDIVIPTAQEPTTNVVKCAVCSKEMSKKMWAKHLENDHYNLAWFEGGVPFDIMDYNTCYLILNDLCKKLGKLVCNICKQSRLSGAGFYAHISVCDKSEEEVDALRQECETCGKRYMPFTLPAHQLGHRKQEEERRRKEETFTAQKSPGPQQTGGRRKAAVKAKVSIEKMTTVLLKEEKSENISKSSTQRSGETSTDDIGGKDTSDEDVRFDSVSESSDNSVEDSELSAEDELGSDVDSLGDVADERERRTRKELYGSKNAYRLKNDYEIFSKSYRDYFTALCESLFSKSPLFPNLKCREFEPVAEDDVERYLPSLTTSCHTAIQNAADSQKWRIYDRFETSTEGGKHTLFTGGPVSALSFAPPADRTAVALEQHYLAVASLRDPELARSGEPCTETPSYPGLIQIWGFGKFEKGDQARFELGLAHDYGAVWCMDWCPSGGWEAEDTTSGPRRLGLLAAACSSGSVYIFAVCHPELLPQTKHRLYKTKPVVELRLCSEEHGRQKVQATSVHWSVQKGHTALSVGYSNGQVALYDLASHSPFLAHLDDGVLILHPYYDEKLADSCISAVCVYPSAPGQQVSVGALSMTSWQLATRAGSMAAPVHQARMHLSGTPFTPTWPDLQPSGDFAIGLEVGWGLSEDSHHSGCMPETPFAWSLHTRRIAYASPAGQVLLVRVYYYSDNQIQEFKKMILSSLEVRPILTRSGKGKIRKPATYDGMAQEYGVLVTKNPKALEPLNANEYPLNQVRCLSFAPCRCHFTRLAWGSVAGFVHVDLLR